MADRPDRDALSDEILWHLPAGAEEVAETVLAALSSAVRLQRPRWTRMVFYDTYDGDLHAAGLALAWVPGRLLLCPPGPCSVRSAAAVLPWSGPAPPVLRTLPEGPLTRCLAEVTEHDAFLPVAECRLRVIAGDVRDDCGKTVVRLRVETFFRGAGESAEPVLEVLRSRVLRGYDPAHAAVAERLRAAGLHAIEDPAEVALLPRLAEAPPRGLSMVPPAPDEPCREGLLRVVAGMLEAARRYEPAIAADIDAECLHRFRVLLRKARSLLRLMRGVLEPTELGALRQDLGEVARRSNRLRDLDVFLARAPAYGEVVPEGLREPFAAVVRDVRQERNRERGRFVRFLRSQRCGGLVRRLEKRLAHPERFTVLPDGEESICQVARRRIRKQCRRIVQHAEEILAAARPEDSDLHRLRIDCKRLRYLLETFGGFFAQEAVAYLGRSARRLQNRLGMVNDLRVQQDALLAFLANYPGRGPLDTGRAAAIGTLAGTLQARRRSARRRALRRLARFRGRRVAKALAAMHCPDHGGTQG
ncbi:MAG: CHAD domain-containing protein [Lentisphaeria bacterium]|nr:CHAD domain-containing protein [Lentisphaeria bacterium]